MDQLFAAADWRRLKAMELQGRKVADAIRSWMPENARFVYCRLGIAFDALGDFDKAIEYQMQHLAIAKEEGDRAGIGQAYGNLGNAYGSLGDLTKAIEYHTQHMAIAKEAGDRAEEGKAYGNLGATYDAAGDFTKAIEFHTQRLAIAKELRDRPAEGRGYGNLGNAYAAQGDFSKAIDYLTQRLAIAKEVRDRGGEGKAYSGLGHAYQSLGDCPKALEYYTLDLKIAQEVGDRMEECGAYGNLGNCYIQLNELAKAVAYYEAHHAMATEIKVPHMQARAAQAIGIALRLQVRADRRRQGPAAGASQDSGPRSPSSALVSLDEATKDKVRASAKWLQDALDFGLRFSRLQMALLAFDAGVQDAALKHLKEHLSWRVKQGRNTCAGCGQTRGEGTPMLTCSRCRVARFCSTDHQKLASRKAASGGRFDTERHKDICGVLQKWREVVKKGVAPDSCDADLVAFLQHEGHKQFDRA
jgi:tetratricopeptide (TPR) repeat protein